MKEIFEHSRFLEVCIAGCLCLALLQTNFYPWLTEVGLDLLFHSRGDRDTSQSIVIVGIDEESLAEYGPWPFSRTLHAQLLGKLQKAKAIGFDLIFSHSNEQDEGFIQVLKISPPVVMAVASNYVGTLLKPGGIPFENSQLGHIETELGLDGIIRRVHLDKHDIPLLAARMVEVAEATPETPFKENQGGQLINFYGPEFSFLYLSYIDVINGVYPEDFFDDRFVLVGSKALALGDVHITPFSKKHPIPGVEVQATVLNNILETSFLKELNLLVWLICMACIIMLLWIWPNMSESYNAISFIAFTFAVILLAVVLFRIDYFLNFIIPLFFLLVSYIVHSVFWWAKITAGMIGEIRSLDYQLEDRIQRVFMTLPASLDYTPTAKKSLRLTTGIHKHINRMHRGIQALALQNGFINHLLHEETPPLILWEKEGGYIVLANNRFSILWEEKLQPGRELPDLGNFYTFLKSSTISESSSRDQRSIPVSSEFGIVDRTVDILTTQRGSKAYHRIVIHRVDDAEQGFNGILASFTDVTEIRELERLKSEVMNIVSHELKLPLTTIMGFAEMLTESLDGDEKNFALQIRKQSGRLAKMIEDFLDIARIESGKYIINKYPFDLLAVIHDAVSGVLHSAGQKEIEIRYYLPKKVSPLLGDESLITQAILNLLDNAVKYSPPGVEVSLSVLELESSIQIDIEDGGEGIADSEKLKVFEKFIRGTDQTKGTGFGLGLSFVKEVIEGHSGTIEVTDSELGGAKFTIDLQKTS